MDKLINSRLTHLLDRAYAPYSNFKVSCILKIKDGQTYSGKNLENASFSATICAERVALCNAFGNGVDPKDITEIHLMSSNPKPIPMCFVCVQTFAEFLSPDVDVFLYGFQGIKHQSMKFSEFIGAMGAFKLNEE